jgi:hypothetical protein
MADDTYTHNSIEKPERKICPRNGSVYGETQDVRMGAGLF